GGADDEAVHRRARKRRQVDDRQSGLRQKASGRVREIDRLGVERLDPLEDEAASIVVGEEIRHSSLHKLLACPRRRSRGAIAGSGLWARGQWPLSGSPRTPSSAAGSRSSCSDRTPTASAFGARRVPSRRSPTPTSAGCTT